MLPTLVNQLKTKYNTKIKKNEEKIHDHDNILLPLILINKQKKILMID